MQYAASVQGVCRDFMVDKVPHRVLFDITLNIAMGHMTFLVGPSGGGKTTFISILSGILSPSQGTVTVLGQRLDQMSDREKVLFRRNHLGFVFQQYHLLPALTAAENAAIPLIAAGMPYADACAQARRILSQIGMQPHADKMPRQLSGGQQQRVAIARAFVHQPQLMICDEPTAALDSESGQAVMQILREMANTGDRAVVVVTHDVRIEHFADRMIEIRDGRMVEEGV